MVNVSSTKISIPTKTTREIIRTELVSAILGSQNKLIYIHAGAGYGKTTLLAQVSNYVKNTVWLTLDGENYIFSFLRTGNFFILNLLFLKQLRPITYVNTVAFIPVSQFPLKPDRFLPCLSLSYRCS